MTRPPALATLTAALACAALAGCGGGSSPSTSASAAAGAAYATAATATPSATTASGATAPGATAPGTTPGAATAVGATGAATTAAGAGAPRATGRRRRHHHRSPGSLPQTMRFPSAASPQFHAEMAALWRGIRTDSVHAALPAFFPPGAYAQVKAIADPIGDWANRLVGEFALDVHAAHLLLGAQARAARLVAVRVPSGFGHWVPPNACYNQVGYYELPNARLVYREAGATWSFGIASMISWRGVWYVVHLGAILRGGGGGGGEVDDPASGAGVSAPSSTC